MKIENRIKTLFEKYRIILWYDDGSLKEEFDNLNLDDVKKLEIDNNEFSIKVEVLTSKDKFLIYSSTEPKKEDNWLLDLTYNYYKFSADSVSLILDELGLDVTKKSFIKTHLSFFKSKERIKKFKKLLSTNDSEEELLIKLMSVILNTDETLSDVIFSLDNMKKFEKYNLTAPFFELLKKYYNYTSKNPSFDEFIIKLFYTHFYYTLSHPTPLNKEAYLLIKQWMDSTKYKDRFISISNKLQEELNIAQELEKFDSILECDTFEICERKILSTLYNIDYNHFKEILKIRKNSFWFEKYKDDYFSFKYYIKLQSLQKFEPTIKDFVDGVEKYANEWFKYDLYYRKFSFYYTQNSHHEITKNLNIEDIYLNKFLRSLNDTFSQYLKEYQFYKHQREFYSNYIEPLLQKNRKVVVIISDAFRYECGVEFKDFISLQSDKVQTNLDYMISSLPSYTQLGMASLLPHKSLEIRDNDIVYADNQSTQGKINREKILKQYNPNSVVFTSEEILNLKDKTPLIQNNLIYIYHNEIDATGDDGTSENQVFQAVNSSFETLLKIIKKVYANFGNIFITADHGFLYTNTPTQTSEFCNYSDGFKINRRFVIGKNLSPSECGEIFNSKQLKLDGDNQFLILKSLNKIRKQGSGNRFVHGGGSLQEIVIPLLQIKYKKQKVSKDVEVEVLLPTISTNEIKLTFYQKKPIDEYTKPITLLMGFYSEDDKLISDTKKLTFDLTDEENRNRNQEIKFTFKEEAINYNNKTIKLKLQKVVSDDILTPYNEISTKLKLSFISDFDEF